MSPLELSLTNADPITIITEREQQVSTPPAPFLLREAAPADAPQILRLSRLLDSINLPTEEQDLTSLLAQSEASFRSNIRRREDGVYLFVLEDFASRNIVGTAMILAKHGTPDSPHFYLEMAEDQRYSKTLKKMFRHTYLTLRRCIDGPTELGGLIVDPAYRQHPAKVGKQLSFVRFLYMAMHPEYFEDEVLAEMMPPLTEDKESLFWECYGKRVTGLSFREADKLSMKDKEFIDALFPPIPLYVCMLPIAVQEQLGKVGPESQGAAYLLEKIGLRFLRHVDPFDGGPFYGAKVKDLVLVQQFHRYQLVADAAPNMNEVVQLLIGWEGEEGFHAARLAARPESDLLYCSQDVLNALQLAEGAKVRSIPFL